MKCAKKGSLSIRNEENVMLVKHSLRVLCTSLPYVHESKVSDYFYQRFRLNEGDSLEQDALYFLFSFHNKQNRDQSSLYVKHRMKYFYLLLAALTIPKPTESRSVSGLVVLSQLNASFDHNNEVSLREILRS